MGFVKKAFCLLSLREILSFVREFVAFFIFFREPKMTFSCGTDKEEKLPLPPPVPRSAFYEFSPQVPLSLPLVAWSPVSSTTVRAFPGKPLPVGSPFAGFTAGSIVGSNLDLLVHCGSTAGCLPLPLPACPFICRFRVAFFRFHTCRINWDIQRPTHHRHPCHHCHCYWKS